MHKTATNKTLDHIINLAVSNTSLFEYQISYKESKGHQHIHVQISQQLTSQRLIFTLCGQSSHLIRFEVIDNLALEQLSEHIYDCAIVDLCLKTVDFLHLYAGTYKIERIGFDSERLGLIQTLNHLNTLKTYGIEIDEFDMITSVAAYTQVVNNSEEITHNMKVALWKAQRHDPYVRRFLQAGQLPLLTTSQENPLEFNPEIRDNNVISLNVARQLKQKAG